MVDIVLRSVLQEKTMINDIIEILEPDLHIITKEGATIRTSKFLIGQGSPILRSLLSNGVNAMSTPSFLFLPDVTASAIIHFISVIKNGFTNGRGRGYAVIKQVREVAEILGFENIPLLIIVEPREVEELVQSVPQALNESVMDINSGEALEVSTDSGNVKISIEMETEDNQNEQDEHSQNDEDDHIATSIDNLSMPPTLFRRKETHQAEHCQDEHIQSRHTPAEHCQDEHMRYDHLLAEHSQNEDEQSSIDVSVNAPNMNANNVKFISLSSEKTNKNMNEGEIEIHEFKGQEIEEVITKVLKKDPDDTSATEAVPKFPCGKCRKPFSCAGTLLVHAEKHGEIKGKRKCTLCNFSGIRTNLLAHIRCKHTKEKLFECPVCQKKFSTSRGKNSHESLHTPRMNTRRDALLKLCNKK